MSTINGKAYDVEGEIVAGATTKIQYDHRNDVFKTIPTRKPFVHEHRKIGRNEPCPCGSGKKFKRCHIGK